MNGRALKIMFILRLQGGFMLGHQASGSLVAIPWTLASTQVSRLSPATHSPTV